MARRIEIEETIEQSVAGFYDTLAPDYDAMTDFEGRFVRERPFFRLLVERHRIRTALDAGCATGFHALLLARLGVQATAVDISPKMLDIVRSHSAELALSVNVVESSFEDLPVKIPAMFDAVFCLGNSLAHLLTKEELLRAVKSFHALLRPGGVLFTQTLNYDRILAGKERIQAIRETDDATFVKHYEYDGETIRFGITKTPRNGNGSHSAANVVRLRPVLKNEFADMLDGAGFQGIQAFGSISMNGFDIASSKDLVVLATRE